MSTPPVTLPTIFPSMQGIVALPEWGVIRAKGEDAASFLHGQLTQDVTHLGLGQACLAGYCSAKGRLLASFIMWRVSTDEIWLACSADLLAPTLKRLSMFVMRARCTLSDASSDLVVHGVLDRAAPPPWQAVPHGGGWLVGLPAVAGEPRALWVASHPFPAPYASTIDAAAWRWLEVMSGTVRVVAATVDRFVPQMINLELVGGVNFQKGCYPGQEVVARSQYRGTLKRRTFLFETTAAAFHGQEVFHSADPEQPAGMVALAATFDHRHFALVEVKIAALEAGELHLAASDGPRIARLAMPYPVPLEAAA